MKYICIYQNANTVALRRGRQRRACVHDRRRTPAACMRPRSPSDASGVHASTIAVDRGRTQPVGRLASMPVEDGPGGGGRKTDVVLIVEVLGRERAGS